MANATGQIDTRIEIVTPENIAFQYRVAGPFRRLPAFLIDLAIRVGVAVVGMIAAVLAFGSAGVEGVGLGAGLLLWFVLSWFYGGLFEALWNGQTPGKRMMRIRVVSVEGQPITPFQAILRNILRDVDSQPLVFYQIGLLAAMLNDRFQRLGDLASGTMVVIEEGRRLQGVVPVREPEAIRIGALIPPSFQPSRSLTRALAAYVERRQLFPLAGDWRLPGTLASRCGGSFSFRPKRISTCCCAACIGVRSSSNGTIEPTSRHRAARRSRNRQAGRCNLPTQSLWTNRMDR